MSLQTKDLVAIIKRRPVVFACGVLILALSLTLYFRWSESSDIQARLDEREKELKRLSNNVKFSAQLDAHLQSLRAANEKIAAGALRAGELARNQQLFYRLEADAGVKLLDLAQQGVANSAKGATTTYTAIPFSLTVRGQYAQVIDFLNRLDRHPTLARVVSASIGKPDEAGMHNLTLTVELLGFRS